MNTWRVTLELPNGELCLDFAEAETAAIVWRGIASAWKHGRLALGCESNGARSVVGSNDLRNVYLVNSLRPQARRAA
jgi:hypothetical protein